jgi:hypothetical protein
MIIHFLPNTRNVVCGLLQRTIARTNRAKYQFRPLFTPARYGLAPEHAPALEHAPAVTDQTGRSHKAQRLELERKQTSVGKRDGGDGWDGGTVGKAGTVGTVGKVGNVGWTVGKVGNVWVWRRTRRRSPPSRSGTLRAAECSCLVGRFIAAISFAILAFFHVLKRTHSPQK